MLTQLEINARRCLAPKDLEDLDNGNLSDPELDQVFSHISSCTRCETLLKEWQSTSDDDLSDKVRKCFAREPIQRDAALSLIEANALDRTGPVVARDRQAVVSDNASLSRSLIGTRIGQNRIVEEIGRGGMGIVFRAEQESVNRQVAIKIIRSGFYAETNAVARFRTEAGAIARLQHPNVAQLFEFSEHGGLPFFVMELVDGGSLEKALAGGPMPYRRAAELTRMIAGAVEYAHQKQVIHRDLKPSNILMTRDGVPKIADFGLAKMLDEEGSDTQTDMILGTPSYMAPEQVAGRKAEIGPVTDVYALGAILYETMTGRPPFKGTDRLDTLRQVREEELTPPSQYRPGLPRNLEAICIRCMAKTPSRRYPSAQAFADDLSLWLDNRRPLGIPGIAGRGFARLRKNWIAAALGVVCLLAVLALYLRDPDRPLRELQGQIAKGEPAILIAEKGKPAWFRWLDGEASSKIVMEQDEVFRLNAFQTAVLELLPAVDCDRYRFQARIRHESSNLHGGVGIFVSRQSQLINGEPVHFVVELHFNDIRGQRDLPIVIGKKPIPPMVNVPQVTPRFFSKQGIPPKLDIGLAGKAGPSFEPPGAGNTNWRDLALVVTPEGVTVEWEGQRFHLNADSIKESIAQEKDFQKRRFPESSFLQIENLTFNPRGGLGLFIYGGSAAFCSATVIPLADDKP